MVEPLQPRIEKAAAPELPLHFRLLRRRDPTCRLGQYPVRADAMPAGFVYPLRSARRLVTNHAIARGLLAIFCCLQGLGTIAIDFNRTHATNSEWPGHERFHLYWQVATVALLALIEVVLLLAGSTLQNQGFYLAVILVAIPILGFFAAFIGGGLYRGTLSDPSGIQPATIGIPGSNIRIDLNLVAEMGGALALAAIIALYNHLVGTH
jgi:hypothetical protein